MYSYFFTFAIGPLAAFLPRQWRRTLPSDQRIHWKIAGSLSGFLEFVASVIGLGYWYMHEMVQLAAAVARSVASAKNPVGMDEHQLSGAALILFLLHPLTWLLLFFFWEGAVRLCRAAFAGNILGTSPLFLVERLLYLFRHREPAEAFRQNAQSFYESIWERIYIARQPELPDQLRHTSSNSEEFLEITASRRKPDWLPPKIVRVDDLYYRLEDFSVGKGTRPFRYTLRRLPCGVPGRSVLIYNSALSVQSPHS